MLEAIVEHSLRTFSLGLHGAVLCSSASRADLGVLIGGKYVIRESKVRHLLRIGSENREDKTGHRRRSHMFDLNVSKRRLNRHYERKQSEGLILLGMHAVDED